MKSTFASFALIGMTVAACVGVGQASAATPEGDVPTIVVRYQDLDPSQARDAARLYQRIESAAQQVCSYYQPVGPAGMQQYRACVDSAIASAVAHVRSEEVTQIREAKLQHEMNRG
jgi:UrcA family protein